MGTERLLTAILDTPVQAYVVPAVAIGFGLVWLFTNTYFAYPVLQDAVERLLGRDRTAAPAVPDDEDLPVVDVLVAAYDEADVIERAVRSVCHTDYPVAKRRLTLLLEPDDDATHAAVADLQESYEFDVLTIPEDYPGEPNKPRALNYGFEHLTGDVVGVVDAEDVVAVDLFRDVAAELAAGADVVQGRLDMANEDDGWLNLLFRAEYGCWYNVVTPAMWRVGYPIPLSGTTCFFDRNVLESVSDYRTEHRPDPWTDRDREWVREHLLAGLLPWDPTNVTEDFELGMVLYDAGFDVSFLETATIEESPRSLDEWLRQRTRWKKGKVQTLFTYRTHPPDSLRSRFHHIWQAMLPHLGPLNVAAVVVLFMLGNLAKYRPSPVVSVVLAFGMAFAVLSASGITIGYLVTSEKPWPTRLRRAVVVSVTLPFYWLLQWGADIRALVQAYGGDERWEKTAHEAVDGSQSERSPATVGRNADRHTLPHRQRWLALGVVVGVAAVLRLYGLGDVSPWVDELYTVAVRGDRPPLELLLHPRDPHPPLYYLLVHGWMGVVGDSVVAVRLLSVLSSLAAVVAVYLLGTELFDDRTGLFGALLLAVSAFHVHFGRFARMYALFTLLTAFSWYWFVRLRDGTRRSQVGYVLVTAALVYTHVYALFVVAAQSVFYALSEVDAGVPRHRWMRMQAALGLLSLPWLLAFAGRVLDILLGTAGGNIEWIPEPSTALLTQTAVAYVGYPALYPIDGDRLALYVLACGLLFVYAAQLLVSVVRVDDDGLAFEDVSAVGNLATLALVPTLVPLVVSMAVPIYVPRYAAPASIGFVLLAARGLRNVPSRRLRGAFLAVVVVSSLVLVGGYHAAETNEPWDDVAGTIEREADGDDVLVEQPGTEFGEYYFADHPVSTTAVPAPGAGSASDLRYVGDLAVGGDRLYLVQYYGTDGPLVEYLQACHAVASVRQRGALTVYRFEQYVGCPSASAVLNGTYSPQDPRPVAQGGGSSGTSGSLDRPGLAGSTRATAHRPSTASTSSTRLARASSPSSVVPSVASRRSRMRS
jgi:cellulose synthase/poly-beta-1,6-N-acetylglucosamine synthase-like glycosyltransferase/4-amino-4-deoxy-L-arabinose transferase-like glycosyltransferase